MRAQLVFHLDDLLQVVEEPRIDVRQLVDLFDASCRS